MSLYESLVEQLRSASKPSDVSWFFDDHKGSVCVKTVLWLLSDPNSGWTVESLRNYLDAERRYAPVPATTEVEVPSVDENRVRELAYLLSESEGFPVGQDERFWAEAVRRLTPNTWYVRSGELKVSGYGELDDVLNLAYNKAADQGLSLGELTSVSTIDFEGRGDNDFVLRTQAQLERFGFWS